MRKAEVNMRKIIAIAVFLFAAFPSLSHAQEREKIDWGLGAGYITLGTVAVGELGATRAALERGAIEKGLIYRHLQEAPVPVLEMTNAAVTGAVMLGIHKFAKSGATDAERSRRKRQAKLLLWTYTGLRAAFLVHNLIEIDK